MNSRKKIENSELNSHSSNAQIHQSNLLLISFKLHKTIAKSKCSLSQVFVCFISLSKRFQSTFPTTLSKVQVTEISNVCHVPAVVSFLSFKTPQCFLTSSNFGFLSLIPFNHLNTAHKKRTFFLKTSFIYFFNFYNITNYLHLRAFPRKLVSIIQYVDIFFLIQFCKLFSFHQIKKKR